MNEEKYRITRVLGEEILDSRGNPTVKVTVTLACGAVGWAAVPSGASTGSYEAHELRDNDKSRYGGKGVLTAVRHVNREIAGVVTGLPADDMCLVDHTLCRLDGTDQKSTLGANAILGTSLATLQAAAAAYGLPLWRYLGGISACRLPVPMMNILNGGAHAANRLDVQEFMIVPYGAATYSDALRMGSEISHSLGALLRGRGFPAGVGDEGGYAPDLSETEEAISLILEAIHMAGYTEREVGIALDAAASEWQAEEGYFLPKSGKAMTADSLIETWGVLTKKYPILSIEDGLGENDFGAWRKLTEKLENTMLVGDDLFVTNTKRLDRGIKEGAGNAILIKPNQIGTVSETVSVIHLARRHGYRVILSHRSGETEDTVIADLAVGLGADFIKAGAPCRSERVCKYNRLLSIEREIAAPLYAKDAVVRAFYPATSFRSV